VVSASTRTPHLVPRSEMGTVVSSCAPVTALAPQDPSKPSLRLRVSPHIQAPTPWEESRTSARRRGVDGRHAV
jgi:hypothetical protein